MTQFSHLPSVPALIVAGLVTLFGVGVSYWYARGRAHSALRMALAAVRCLILAAVAVCLMDPEWVEKIGRAHV